MVYYLHFKKRKGLKKPVLRNNISHEFVFKYRFVFYISLIMFILLIKPGKNIFINNFASLK